MNLDNLFSWVAGIVIAFAMSGNLGTFQKWVWQDKPG
jgi:hypothetical protein